MKTVGEAWAIWSKTIPATATPDEVAREKRTFYAGAGGMFQMLLALRDKPDDAAEGFLTISRELAATATELQREKAAKQAKNATRQ